ncbi:phage baseplate assembly protein V [Clostridium beijerinckii]|uniref:phage baseplate assembly protein V n=1 Tax=Clostridium beijerinckii TaxID=1520 RepID=UPI0005A36FF4|nr:phage baseplate assembly protein V [Clostridium beijerinckii]
MHNSLLSGASLEGKVIDRQGEQVKLQLKIDDNQNNEEASWFRFAPPTGNMMYCMPVIGTDARLYFPNESSEEPIVTGCLRTNGSSSPLSIKFEDNVGVTLTILGSLYFIIFFINICVIDHRLK